MNDIAIIGGGAAGLAAAVGCAEAWETARAGERPTITIYEAAAKVGRPILRSGNGRCNFSHWPLDPAVYEGVAFVTAALEALERRDPFGRRADGRRDANAVLRAFDRWGLVARPESDGRLYPAANRASVVLDVLLRQLDRFGVVRRVETPITRLVPPREPGRPHTLEARDGTLHRARTVIIAVGGEIGRNLLPDDVPCANPRPVLGPLRLRPNPFKIADGQRLRCRLGLRRNGAAPAAETGEALFRTYGLSGIAVMNLSRFARPGDTLICDWLPEGDAAGLEGGATSDAIGSDAAIARTRRWLMDRRDRLAASPAAAAPIVSDLLCGLFSRLVAEALCHAAHLEETAPATDERLAGLARVIRATELSVSGLGPLDACQVHRGGADRAALDPTTMAVAGHPGLHVVGEAVDVDGPCGGYNLHWAWASGLLGAYAIAASGREGDDA